MVTTVFNRHSGGLFALSPHPKFRSNG